VEVAHRHAPIGQIEPYRADLNRAGRLENRWHSLSQSAWLQFFRIPLLAAPLPDLPVGWHLNRH
jgi:hypothetical protein